MKLTPQIANTLKKICSLPRDNISYKDYWILVGEKQVTIAKQKKGEPAEVVLGIPKSVFNRFIKFYLDN
jgi:hypothetical protein